jgi:16S rRNA processing protein rimM
MTDKQDILTVGRTNGAYGVRGWVRVIAFEEPEILAATNRWFLTDIRGGVRELTVLELKPHGNMLIARIEGVDQKEAADALRGRIGVLREDFPEAGEGEVWAADVIGLPVVNRDGVTLGRVTEIGTNTVQDIFKVEGGEKVNGVDPVYLIPDVEQYVLDVDLDEGVVLVDWDPSWI